MKMKSLIGPEAAYNANDNKQNEFVLNSEAQTQVLAETPQVYDYYPSTTNSYTNYGPEIHEDYSNSNLYGTEQQQYMTGMFIFITMI